MRSVRLPLLWTITWVRIVAISTCAFLAFAFALMRHRAPIYPWGCVRTTLTQNCTMSAEQLRFVTCSPFMMKALFAVFLSPLRGLSPARFHFIPVFFDFQMCLPFLISPPPHLYSFVVLMLSVNTLFLLNMVPGSKPCFSSCPTCISRSN